MNSVQIGQKSYEMPPREEFSVAHFLTVADVDRSARFYETVFGGRILSGGDSNGAPGYIQRRGWADPVVVVPQLGDFEFPKCWGPKNHKAVLAQFAVSGLQFLWRAILPDCSFRSMEGLFWLIGQNKYVEFATPKVMAINL
jgi:hypothetical protein